MIEDMVLHDMPYVVTIEGGKPVAYPKAEWDYDASAPRTQESEQCDCLETAVHYYLIRKDVLHSGGFPVLSERDVRILDSVDDIRNGVPRKLRHVTSPVER